MYSFLCAYCRGGWRDGLWENYGLRLHRLAPQRPVRDSDIVGLLLQVLGPGNTGTYPRYGNYEGVNKLPLKRSHFYLKRCGGVVAAPSPQIVIRTITLG